MHLQLKSISRFHAETCIVLSVMIRFLDPVADPKVKFSFTQKAFLNSESEIGQDPAGVFIKRVIGKPEGITL